MTARAPTVPNGQASPEAASGSETLFDAMIEESRRRPAPAAAAPASIVAECVDDRHPSLIGRVRIRAAGAEGTLAEAWVPVLAHVVVRRGDRVLVQHATNWPEPIVVGVLDGYESRPAPEPIAAASISLRADECITVRDDRDRPLFELRRGAHGPELRLTDPDVTLAVPGRLCMRADSIRLESTAGPVEIDAQGDVRVRGELIELN